MKNTDIALELIQGLTKAENEFGLSEILQSRGILKDEPVTVEFKWGEENLLTCQRNLDSSSTQCYWERTNREDIGIFEERQAIENIGQEIAEVLSRAGMLPTFKNALLKRNVTISETQPVIVQFSFTDGVMIALKCPCSPKPCCQVAG